MCWSRPRPGRSVAAIANVTLDRDGHDALVPDDQGDCCAFVRTFEGAVERMCSPTLTVGTEAAVVLAAIDGLPPPTLSRPTVGSRAPAA